MNVEGMHRKGQFSLQDLIESIKEKPEFCNAGAIILFIGVVRGKTQKGERVEKLELEAYEEKADNIIDDICEDLTQEEGVVDVQIHHFVGNFNVGDDLVYVAVTGTHRKYMFPVLQKAVERYKSELPIFKKECITDEKGEAKSYWVSEH